MVTSPLSPGSLGSSWTFVATMLSGPDKILYGPRMGSRLGISTRHFDLDVHYDNRKMSSHDH